MEKFGKYEKVGDYQKIIAGLLLNLDKKFKTKKPIKELDNILTLIIVWSIEYGIAIGKCRAFEEFNKKGE